MTADPIRLQVEGLLAMVRGLAEAGITPSGLWEDVARDVVRLHAELTLELFRERGEGRVWGLARAGLPPGVMACVILGPILEALRHAPAGTEIPLQARALIAAAEEAGLLAQGRPS